MKSQSFRASNLASACAVLSVATLLAACGGGVSDPNQSDTAAQQGAATTTVAPVDSGVTASASIEQIAAVNRTLEAAGEQPVASDSSAEPDVASPIADAPLHRMTAQAVSNSSYITSQQGHFYKDSKRVKFWGINLSMSNMTNKTRIDNTVARIKSLGFNGVRLWPTDSTFYGVDKSGQRYALKPNLGDNSELDRLDYMVNKLKQANIAVHMTMLQTVGASTLPYASDPEVRSWATASTNQDIQRQLRTYAPFVSEAYRTLLKNHYVNALSRANPYTGRRYHSEPAVSMWELINESRFIECSVSATCMASLPPIAMQSLSKAWQANAFWNPSGAALPADFSGFLADSANYSAFTHFLSDLFVNASNQLRDAARGVGGAGSGVYVQPFLFNTYTYATNAVAHYAYSRGDTLALSGYHTPLAASSTGGYESSPWMPATMGGKRPSLIESLRVKDKPTIVYETSFFRPYPYRAEWGPMFAAMALRQDWDAVYLYAQGQPENIYINDGAAPDYATKPMPDPVPGVAHKDSYTYGFHNGGDQVTMGSWMVGGRLFLSTNESPAPSVHWQIPVSSIFALNKNFGYPSTFLGQISDAKNATFVVEFISGTTSTCLPCRPAVSQPSSFAINWDTANQRLSVTTPGGGVVAGRLSGSFGTLIPGISANVSNTSFGLVAALATSINGSSSSERSLFSYGKLENTGKVFDASRVDMSQPYGVMYGMVHQGTMPLIHSGPQANFFTTSSWGFTPYNFKLGAMAATSGRTTTYSVPASSGTFWVRATP